MANIELLKEEALRLVTLSERTLKELREIHGLMGTQAPPPTHEQADFETPKGASLDLARVDTWLAVLADERQKLEQLDMVIAVVGTMKAGKSTAINAIVGTEILPNRNGPMTAIPTLIRHTPGQKSPVLILQHLLPLNEFRTVLRNKLGSKAKAEEVAHIEASDSDLQALVDSLLQDLDNMPERHEGSQAIFEALKHVNDLVRLAPRMGLKFPFEQFRSIDKLPLIEVEFTHLRDVQVTQGRLTLLDTAGPNEAGQDDLDALLEEQLNKASGVLCVTDYTQLKSEADAEVRQQVSEKVSILGDRLHVLVNKFDQRDRNGMDEEEVKSVVVGMMKGPEAGKEVSGGSPLLTADRVYPVSAQRAYLGNRARHEIEVHGQLPNFSADETCWVTDFGRIAFGEDWKEDLADTSDVYKKAERIWEKSGFSAPLNRVIRQGYEQAALQAVLSAAQKMQEYSAQMHNTCEVREKAIGRDAEVLQALIDQIKADIETVNVSQEKAKAGFLTMTNDFEKSSKDSLEHKRNEISEKLQHTFAATEDELRSLGESEKAKERQRIFEGLRSLPSAKSSSRSTRAPNPQESKVKALDFGNDKDRAEKWIQNFDRLLSDLMKAMNKDTESDIKTRMECYKNTLDELRGNVTKTVGELTQRMDDRGFIGISIQWPDLPEWGAINPSLVALKKALQTEEKKGVRLVEQKGVLGSIKRGFGWFFGLVVDNEIGLDQETYSYKAYKIEIETAESAAQECLAQHSRALQNHVKNKVFGPTDKAVTEALAELTVNLERLRHDLICGLNDKEKSQEDRLTMINQIRERRRPLPGMKRDLSNLTAQATQAGAAA